MELMIRMHTTGGVEGLQKSSYLQHAAAHGRAASVTTLMGIRTVPGTNRKGKEKTIRFH